MEGTVKIFSKRAYGFIEASDGMSYFVHITQTGGRYLKSGETVQFDIGDDPRNPKTKQAMNVVIINNISEKEKIHEEEIIQY